MIMLQCPRTRMRPLFPLIITCGFTVALFADHNGSDHGPGGNDEFAEENGTWQDENGTWAEHNGTWEDGNHTGGEFAEHNQTGPEPGEYWPPTLEGGMVLNEQTES